MPRGRPGDRPRAVDGRRRGGEAPARGGAPAPGVVAAVPQRAFQAPGLRVLEGAEGLLRRALGEDARALMDAFSVELLEPAELDLTAGCVERARAERGEAPLAE